MKVKISAVVITFNEERNIERCLKSLVGVADELVVVDSYSTDRTEEICKSYHARFIKHRFEGHIQQKNWAVLQASSPYILSLDADEVLSDELKTSILKVKEEWAHDGYYFNRLTNYCGKWIRHTTWYPSRKLRLWDARKGSWGGYNPHDRFYLKSEASQSHLKGDLLHYSYYSVSDHVSQINSFSSILAKSYFERGRRVNILAILFRPFWRFINDFLLRAGFKDGYYGFVVSIISAHEVFLKYVKLKGIYQTKRLDEKKSICFFNTQESWGGGEKWHCDVASYVVERNKEALFISSPESPLSEKMKALEIPGYQLQIGNMSFLNPIKMIRIIGIFRKEKVGVLVTNLSEDMKIASIAARWAGVPRIIFRRGSAIPIRDSLMNRFLYRRVVTNIIANSLETKRTILAVNKDLVPDGKIKVIYNGIHLSNYHPQIEPLYVPGNGEIVLGSAGRLSEEKGHIHLLEMMQHLEDNGVSFKLLLAGEGRMLNSLEKKAKELGMAHRVEFLGFVEDMPAFFRSLDVFLLSSHYEGFGYVITEAMASSLPVVAFDIKSTSEIILDGETGYITRANDPEEMAKKVMVLAESEELRNRMGKKGRARVEKLFSFEEKQREIWEVLKGID
jgi:glycosyltransferase involved in cell wall biosynthesis